MSVAHTHGITSAVGMWAQQPRSSRAGQLPAWYVPGLFYENLCCFCSSDVSDTWTSRWDPQVVYPPTLLRSGSCTVSAGPLTRTCVCILCLKAKRHTFLEAHWLVKANLFCSVVLITFDSVSLKFFLSFQPGHHFWLPSLTIKFSERCPSRHTRSRTYTPATTPPSTSASAFPGQVLPLLPGNDELFSEERDHMS